MKQEREIEINNADQRENEKEKVTRNQRIM
jgi:hypothetical protein